MTRGEWLVATLVSGVGVTSGAAAVRWLMGRARPSPSYPDLDQPPPPDQWVEKIPDECDPLDPETWAAGKICVARGDRWVLVDEADPFKCPLVYNGYCVAVDEIPRGFMPMLAFRWSWEVRSPTDGSLIYRHGRLYREQAEAIHDALRYVDGEDVPRAPPLATLVS